MSFPFRNPVAPNDEEEWEPPDYATPSKEWTPPDYAKPHEEKKESKGFFRTALDQITHRQPLDVTKAIPAQINQFLEEHPNLVKYGRRFLFGATPEEMGLPKNTRIGGDEALKLQATSDYLRRKGRESGSYAKGFAGSVAGDVLDLATSGFDPRVSGLKSGGFSPEEVKTAAKQLLPVSEDARGAARDILSQRLPKEIPLTSTPETELPAEFVQPGKEDIFNKAREEQPRKDKSLEEWRPPDYATPTDEQLKPGSAVKTPESKKELATATFAYEDPNTKEKMFNVKGGVSDKSTVSADKLKELGIPIPSVSEEEAAATRGLSGAQLRERALQKITEGFGGSGHPSEPDYVNKVLEAAGDGEPGLSVEDKDIYKQVTYRDKSGNPIATAKLVTDQSGNTMVQDLALDKSKGLLGGRAMKSIGEKLADMGVTEASGTMSDDAKNFLQKMKNKQIKIIEHPLLRKTETGELVPGTPESLHPQLTGLRNYGDGVLHLDFDKTKLMTEENVESLLKDKGYNAKATEMFSNENMPSRFRVDITGDDPVHSEELGNEIEKSVGGSFDKNEITEMHGGLGGIGGGKGKKQPFKGPNGPVLDKLFSALESSKELGGEQEAINRAERAKRFAASAGVKSEGMEGAAKSLAKLRGEYEKVSPESNLNLSQKDADSLFTAVKRSRITEGEKARGYTALFKLMNGEKIPTRSELAVLDNVFGQGFGDRITEMHGGIGAVSLKISKLANTAKSLQNAISLAAPLRHGIGLVARKEFYPAFADMFKFFGNKEYYNSAMQALENRPTYLLGRESGLFLSKPGSLQNAEEEFLNSYAGHIPIAREAVAASQRAYTGFLNKLRADTFDSMIATARKLGNEPFTMVGDKMVPSKATEAIANYINNATGRGSLGNLNKMTNELNLLFWSPRMISSRVNMLANPTIYTNLPKGMRLEGLKSLFGIAALGTMIDTLSAYAGAKVSTNILSSDFGKSRFGKEVIDPWGGFQQYVVGAARFLAGKTDSPYPTTRLGIAGRFLENKLSPAARLADLILTSKPTKGGAAGDITTQYNQKTNIPTELRKTFTPIFIQDLEDLIKNDPDWADNIGLTSAMGAASLTGMKQEYPEPRTGRFRFSNRMKLQ